MSEYLGSAVLEMRANLAPLARGLAEGERLTQRSLLAMDTNVGRRMASMSAGMSRVGTNMTRTLTVPILGVAAASAKLAIDFNRSMELIHTQAGATQAEVDKLKQKVLDLAHVVPFSGTKLSQGLFHLESIGLRGAKAMDALKTAAQGAAVGNTDLEQTATALGSAWLVNIKGAGKLHSANNLLMKGTANLRQVMGVLNATVGVGNMRMSDLVTSLGTGLLPMAKRAGLSLQDMMGALAVFSDEGYKAYSAATQMGTALHYLYDPTAKATGALQKIGITSGQLAGDMHKPRGLLVALSDLQHHLDATFPSGSGKPLTVAQTTKAVDAFRASLEKSGVSAKSVNTQVDAYKQKLKDLGSAQVAQEAILGDIFPAGRGRVLSVLMNQLNRYQQKLNQIDSGSSKFGKDVTATMEQPAVKIQLAWTSLQAELTNFGQHSLPPLLAAGQAIVHVVDDVFKSFDKLSPGMQKAIIDGGLLVAAIGPAMRIASFFLGGVTKLASVAAIASRLAMGKGWKQATTGSAAGAALTGSRGALVMDVADMNVARLVVASMAGGGALPAGFRPRNAKGQYLPGYSATVSGKQYGTPAASPAAPSTPGGAVVPSAAATRSGAGALRTAGGLALRGLGALAVVGFAAPLVLGLKSAVDAWAHNDAMAEGRAWSSKFLAPLPKAIQDHFHEGLAQTAANTAKDKYLYRISGLHPTRGGTATGPQDPKLLQQLQHDYTQQGQLAGEATVKGLQSVKDPSTPVLLRDFLGQLKKLPAEARPQAARVMAEYAAQLEQSKKLPAGAADSIIQNLAMILGPKFASVLQKQGLSTGAELKKQLKFDEATKQLTNTLAGYKAQFGDFSISTKITGDNINENAKRAFDHLHEIIKTSTGQTRKDAIAELHLLQHQTASTFDAMLGKTNSSMKQLSKFIVGGTAGAAKLGGQNLWGFANQVVGAMNSSQISTKQGATLIAKALNVALKAFGGKQIPVPTFDTAVLAAVGIGRNAGTGATTGAANAGAGVVAGLPHAARGALVQVGRPGERGRDHVPMSVGGSDIVVGRGEVVGVFNADQQREMARTYRGGLQGFFSGRRWKPHYMAHGGYRGPSGQVVVGSADMSVGQEPQIYADLRKLAGELRNTVYVISGYRSPAHSVAVGGFANDPHTRGQAADIGVGSGLRSSMFGVSETSLRNVGLYRPFYPPDPNEVNHVQLLAGAAQAAISGVPGGAGIVKQMWKNITGPKVRGSGTMAEIVRGAMRKATRAANRWGQRHSVGASGVGMGGIKDGTWFQVANQIAKRHGWSPAEVQAWRELERREDGSLSLTASNSSGAYGLAQFINGPGEYAQYGGNANTLVGQLTAMANYIAGRYGAPSGALAGYYNRFGPGNSGYAHGGMVPGKNVPKDWTIPSYEGKLQDRYSGVTKFLKRLWGASSHLYHRGGSPMPPATYVQGQDGLFVGTDVMGKKGHRQIFIPNWIVDGQTARVSGQKNPFRNRWTFFPGLREHDPGIVELMLHEWVHEFQDNRAIRAADTLMPKGLQREWADASEGGAEAFAKAFSPQILPKFGIGPAGPEVPAEPYYKPMHWVLDHLGMDWVKNGQFGRGPKAHFAGGGIVPGFARGGMPSLTSLDHQYPKHFTGTSGATLPYNVIAALAEKMGMPGLSMADITVPEAGRMPGIVQSGQPPATTGWGLWQITPGTKAPSIGVNNQLLNPVTNAKVAKWTWDRQHQGAWNHPSIWAKGVRHYTGAPLGSSSTSTKKGGVTTPGLSHHKGPKHVGPSWPAAQALATGALHLPNPIKKAFRGLNSLLRQAGSSGKLPDLIDYTSRHDDVTVQQWADATPGLNTDTGIVTPPNGAPPYIDYAYVRMRLSELNQLNAWQTEVRDKLLKANKKVGPLIHYLRAQIRRRRAMAVKIREQIRRNVHQVNNLTTALGHVRNEKKPVPTALLDKQKLKIEKQLRAERALAEPFPSPKTQAQRLANAAFKHTQKLRVAALENAYSALGVSALGKNESAKSAQRKRELALEGSIKHLKAENVMLGGDTMKIGTGGEIRALGLSSLQQALKAAQGDKTTLRGASGIGGLLGDATLALERTGTVPTAIFNLSDPQLQVNLHDAILGSSGTADQTAMLALLQQQNATLAQQYQVSQAGFGVLSRLPPFAGSFEHGGIVPGPAGAPRTIIAHGQEEFMGVNGQRAPRVHVVMEDHRTRVFVDDVEQVVRTVTGRASGRARRALPGQGGR